MEFFVLMNDDDDDPKIEELGYGTKSTRLFGVAL
jgi:hypothetical protein